MQKRLTAIIYSSLFFLFAMAGLAHAKEEAGAKAKVSAKAKSDETAKAKVSAKAKSDKAAKAEEIPEASAKPQSETTAKAEEKAEAGAKPKSDVKTGTEAKPKAGACSDDTDCRGRKVCFASTCTELFGRDSLLRVRLNNPVNGALLYIDNTAMGNIPWEGIIPAGSHQIEVRAPGYETRKLVGESVAGRADTVLIEMEPAPVEEKETQDTQKSEAESEKGWEPAAIGKYYAGVLGGFGFGGVRAGGESSSTVDFSGHLVGGMRLLETPYWIDVGLNVSYASVKLKPEDWGDYQRLILSAVPRGYYPIHDQFMYAAAEAEVGLSISYQNHFLFALRGGGSIFLSKLIEIRLNLIGIDFFFGKSVFIGYSSTIGIAIRFL